VSLPAASKDRNNLLDVQPTPSAGKTKLTVSDVEKSFLSPSGGKIEVLKRVSFQAVAGESIAVMGASGAGKSTLLNLLGGLETVDRGVIVLDEYSIAGAKAQELAQIRNTRIGFVFQFHHLLPDLTAAENTALPLMISGLSQKRAVELAIRALEHVGLGERASHPVSYLSGGEQQRVAVCRALIAEPVLVLADEPTGNLDATIEDEISEHLVTYARNRPGILIVATHNERLARMCDRLLILKDGILSSDN
jgi:lipoprotein-releasing system ATP-binding protein